MAKHLVDIDDDVLSAAQAELGASTIKDTVDQALRIAASSRDRRVAEALDVLAAAEVDEPNDAWR